MQYESIAEVANKLIDLIKKMGILHFQHGKHRAMLTVWHRAKIPLAQCARTATLKPCTVDKEAAVARLLKVLIVATCMLSTQADAGAVPAVPDAEFVVVARDAVVLPPQGLPELPEPAVLIMMLLGICVIGYRARHDSQETFR
jgi:hypothetical protein